MKIINRIITRLCGFVYSLLHTAHDNSELSIFFFFLTTSLFLGDGKQPFVDAWWALGILTMYGVRYYQQGKLDLRPFPRPIGFVWMALILYYIILIPFSDSAGYSVTATIRLIEAYLVYVMFVTISSEKTTALFIKGLLFVGVVASLASFIFLLFPTLASFLPPMNLLYATYGHNHLADLLLPIFPLVLDSRNPNFFDSGNRWRRVIVLVYVIGMLLTFARGAWILLILYLLFFAVRSKNTTTRKIGLSIAAATLVVFLFVSLVSLRGVPQNGGFMARIARQVQKPSLLEDGRWEYWRQAIEAIKERPLFGSGPGTFYLESKRLQARPSSYSWFAHSFPFEVTVETGVVGLLILTLLLSVVLSHTIKKIITQKHNNVPATPLFWGAILVFMYGLYEFNLDYAVIWLLVWAILGVLAKNDGQENGRSRNSEFMSITALAVVVLFYLMSMSSVASSVYAQNSAWSFLLAPFHAEQTKKYLKLLEFSHWERLRWLRETVSFFHQRDPLVRLELAILEEKEQDLFNAQEDYRLVAYGDPKNSEARFAYIKFLFRNNDRKKYFKELCRMGKELLSQAYQISMEEVCKTTQPESALAKLPDVSLVQPNENHLRQYLAKVFYTIGAVLADRDPVGAERMLTASRNIDPWLSYYHIELASYYYFFLKDYVRARKTLQYCTLFRYAKEHCNAIILELDDTARWPLPFGFYEQPIRAYNPYPLQ